MPRLVWLKAEKIDPFSNYETPQIGQYFGIKDYMAKSVVASTHLAKSKPGLQPCNMVDTTVIFIRESGGVDGSATNRSVVHMMKGKQQQHDWKGPMVILSQLGTKMNPLIFQFSTGCRLPQELWPWN